MPSDHVRECTIGLAWGGALGSTVSPQNLYVETLTPNVTVFGNGACRRELKLNEVMRKSPNPTGLVSLEEKEERSLLEHTPRKGLVKTERR